MIQRPIRVLFVVTYLQLGGAERHVMTLVSRMDRTMFSPSVLCIGEGGGFFDDVVGAGIPARALGLGKSQALRALRELVLEMRRQQADIVVVQGGFNAEVLGRLAARIANVPATILWVHNMGDIEPIGTIRALADRLLDRCTTSYFGVANAQRSQLIERFHYPESKVRILHNGVDVADFAGGRDSTCRAELGLSADDQVVGIVAALRPEKDHATFLRAARLVVDARPQTRFLLVGDGPLRSELEDLCDRLGLNANVVFAGVRRDVARVLGAMDIFALTSRTECFPIAVLEAMASGLPVVSTNVGGIPEMVSDGVSGFLVPKGDAVGLANRLLDILTDPVTGQRMGHAARDRVASEFQLTRTVRIAEQAIAETAYSGAPPAHMAGDRMEFRR